MKQLTVVLVKPIYGSCALIAAHPAIDRGTLDIQSSDKITPTRQFIADFYPHVGEHLDRVCEYLCGKKIEILVITGENAIDIMREHVLTLREMFKLSKPQDGWHASDSPQEAAREIAIVEKYLDDFRIFSQGWLT